MNDKHRAVALPGAASAAAGDVVLTKLLEARGESGK